MNAIEKLKSVLCSPDGEVCIHGSEEDRRIVAKALSELQSAPVAPKIEQPPIGALRLINGELVAEFVPFVKTHANLFSGEAIYARNVPAPVAPNMIDAFNGSAPMSAPAAPKVPDVMSMIPPEITLDNGLDYSLGYKRGWNDCRNAMLAAAQAQEGK